jgi:hypothetical protein
MNHAAAGLDGSPSEWSRSAGTTCDVRLAISEVFAALPTFLAQTLIDASLFISLHFAIC